MLTQALVSTPDITVTVFSHLSPDLSAVWGCEGEGSAAGVVWHSTAVLPAVCLH